jgi:hypothetical protein
VGWCRCRCRCRCRRRCGRREVGRRVPRVPPPMYLFFFSFLPVTLWLWCIRHLLLLIRFSGLFAVLSWAQRPATSGSGSYEYKPEFDAPPAAHSQLLIVSRVGYSSAFVHRIQSHLPLSRSSLPCGLLDGCVCGWHHFLCSRLSRSLVSSDRRLSVGTPKEHLRGTAGVISWAGHESVRHMADVPLSWTLHSNYQTHSPAHSTLLHADRALTCGILPA